MRIASLKAISSLFLVAFAFATTALADNTFRQFLPENNLWKEDSLEVAPNVTEDLFNEVIKAGTTAYAEAAKQRKEGLIINSLWDNSTVNASTRRVDGTVSINMYGGLARREEITVEAFALVMCHELSHAYGGAPYIRPETQIAAEGQADYIGAKECLNKVLPFVTKSDNQLLNGDNGSIQKICDRNFSKNADENMLCVRKFSAGFSLGKLLAAVTTPPFTKTPPPIPQYDTPDTEVTSDTILTYPATIQCRLDTFAAGFLGWTQPSCWFKNGSKNNPVTGLAE